MTAEMISIEQMTSLSERDIDELADLLMAIVDQGASVGFLPPLEPEDARAYWAHAIEPENIVFLVARRKGAIVGTVQLEYYKSIQINRIIYWDTQRYGGIGIVGKEGSDQTACLKSI